jgi:dephospho-CoA kinase
VLGLTGGIGAGKSTVARMFASLGAVTIDADAIARAVVQPGGSAHDAVVRRFGTADRRRLAERAFTDPAARADLNAIVHPAVEAVVRERLAEEAARSTAVVVLEVPLLVEAGWSRLVSTVVVVDCPEDVAVERLARDRGMPQDEIRRRMAAQASRAERLAVADVVLSNDGSLEALRAQVEQRWADVTGA